MYVVFEGIDKTGKSTQIILLKEYLQSKNYKVTTVFEPGFIDNNFRDILLHDKSINDTEELLLFLLDRCKLYKYLDEIKSKYDIIISDRSWISTFVYQLLGKNKKSKTLSNFLQFSIDFNLVKTIDILFYFMPDFDIIKSRIKNPDKFENIDNLKKYHEYYLYFLEKRLSIINKVYKIDSSKSIEDIHKDIIKYFEVNNPKR